MKKAITKRTTSLALILTLLLLLCTTLFVGVKNVFADETVYFKGYGENLSYSDLYNATNTYDFNPAALISSDNEKPWFSNNDWYDMSERNGNQVTDSAMITVFTYGYQGAVNNWSTDGYGNFAYDKQSIITQYSEYIYKNTNKKPEIYYAKLEGEENNDALNNFKLVRLNNDDSSAELYNANIDGQSVEYLGDLSKHTIIVFDTRMNDGSNNKVYSELNYILSRVIYNYRYMLNGILPGINLIGHSRGGLTNLQYTLDHPDLVKNVFSFDTPYADTTAGYIDGVKEGFKGDGFTDITNLDVYSKYRKRWNENYDRLYSNVRIHALGGYSTISDALKLLQSNIDTLLGQMNNGELNITADKIESIVNAVNFYFNYANLFSFPMVLAGGLSLTTPIGLPLIVLSIATPSSLIENPESVLRIAYNLVKYLPVYEQMKGIVGDFSGLQYVIKDISYDNVVLVGSPMFYNDCTVDLNSQLGGVSAKERAYEAAQIAAGQEVTTAEAYKGFIKKTKQFTMSNVTRNENGEIKTGSAYSPCVVHLLAPYDKEFIDYVLDNVTFDGETSYGKGWQYQSNGNGTLCVTGYRGYFNEDVLEIPSTIEGKCVTAVDDLAFAGKFAEGRKISVIIPEGVTKIGYGAFNGCKAISNISLPNSLTYIDDGAFADSIGETDTPVSIVIPSGVTKIGARAFKNTNISSVTLPSGLQKIGDETFLGCSKLSTVSVGQNVTEIGYNAFGGCGKLTNITVNSQNAKYTSENGVLYTKNKETLLCYPSGKTATSFTVDTACLELSNYAFTNNASLQTLNLNNVNTINSYAVINCPALATLNAPKTDFIYSAGVAATKLTDEAEDVVIGKVLYKKTSAGETVVVGDNIESISAYAFVGNDSVKKVVLGKNVESVCEYAFTGCSALESIEALNLDKVVHLGTGALDGCSENIDIKVPSNNLGNYKTDAAKGWTEYADKITTKQVSVKYYVDGSLKETKTLAYGDNLGTVDNPQKAGYLFKGWRDGNGKAYDSLSVVDNADGLELFAEFEAVTYTITFRTGCDVFVQNMMFTVEEDKTLPTITREGYTFKGWHTSSDFTEANNIGTVIRKGSITNNVTLYAEWQANEYTITFVDSSGQNVENMTVTYGQPYTLPVLTKENYTFNGWRTEAGIYYSQISGASCFAVWNIAADTTLYASWTRITFKIKIDMDGRVYWVGGRDTISDTETDIEAGELGTVDDLNEKFNPRKISYKEGHKFKYFAKKGFEDKLLSWSELYGNTPVDGAIYEITAIFEKEFFQLIIDGVVSSEGINPIEGYYDDTIVYSDRLYEAVSEIGKDFDYWAISRYPINANEATKEKYPVNSKFDPEKIPDLTVGIEDNGAIYLKAVMNPKTYVMTLNSEYCVSSTTMTVKYGETVKLPVYVKEGAIFNGWKIGNTVFADSNGDMLSAWTYTENKLILADWTLIEYTITYKNVEGSMDSTQKFTIEDLDFELPTPARKGGRFEGWFEESDFDSSTKETTIKNPGNITLYAKWAHLCNLSFNPNGGTISGYSAGEIVRQTAYTGDEITLPIPTYLGQKSGNWKLYGGENYSFGSTLRIPENNDFIYYENWDFNAEWIPNTYTITFNFNEGRSSGSSTTSVVATFGQVVPNITLPVREGYRFVAYRGYNRISYYSQDDKGNLTKLEYNFAGDITLYAHWEVVYPELSVIKKIGGVWKIGIKNNGSTSITFEYNKKMLFEKDAKVWNVNDKDKGSVFIGAGASAEVDISENWFATCIVVSVKVGYTRYITYAYNLNADGTITCVNCTVSA